MLVSATKSRMILERLASLLGSPFLPVQEVIAREVGCDQPFISRAANRRLIRITDRVTELRRYAIMRIRAERLAGHAASANKRQTDQGIDGDYADEAVSGLHMYLADGYDARLIVEQIAVLRRAQRIRRPGIPPSSQRRAAMELAR